MQCPIWMGKILRAHAPIEKIAHVANHGYSHLSGIDKMSLMYMCFHSYSSALILTRLRPRSYPVSDPFTLRRGRRLSRISIHPLFLNVLVVLLVPGHQLSKRWVLANHKATHHIIPLKACRMTFLKSSDNAPLAIRS
jgi:hypothetical protein